MPKTVWRYYETIPEQLQARHYKRKESLDGVLVSPNVEVNESGYIIKKGGVRWYTPEDKFHKMYRRVRHDEKKCCKEG